jgi:hypothetical protein
LVVQSIRIATPQDFYDERLALVAVFNYSDNVTRHQEFSEACFAFHAVLNEVPHYVQAISETAGDIKPHSNKGY